MAIDTGLGVTCTDLQATGGIKQILLRSWASNDAVVYGNAAGEHDIDSILTSGSPAAWFVFEFKNETPAMTINATLSHPGAESSREFSFASSAATIACS